MKLSEFESVGEVVLVKEPAWSTVQANLNQFCDLKDGDLLYTKKVAQEYAKECVKAALKEYAGPYSEKKANSIISKIVK